MNIDKNKWTNKRLKTNLQNWIENEQVEMKNYEVKFDDNDKVSLFIDGGDRKNLVRLLITAPYHYGMKIWCILLCTKHPVIGIKFHFFQTEIAFPVLAIGNYNSF